MSKETLSATGVEITDTIPYRALTPYLAVEKINRMLGSLANKWPQDQGIKTNLECFESFEGFVIKLTAKAVESGESNAS